MNRVGVLVGLALVGVWSPAAGQVVCTAPVGGPVPNCFVVDSIAFGTVMDGRTGVGLPGVTVEVLGRDAVSETDSTGSYSVEQVAPGFELQFEHACYYSVRLARSLRLDLPVSVGLPLKGGPGCPAPGGADPMSPGIVSGHMYSADPIVSSAGRGTFVDTDPYVHASLVDQTSGAFLLELSAETGAVNVVFQGMCWLELTVLDVRPSDQEVVLDVRVPYRWDPKYADLEGCGIRDPVER